MLTNPRPNPYVGPRAFQTGEKLYGRDSELQQLLDLLIAERIVLLYSPSGAGKSSLIHAGLVPRLRTEGFRVLPVIRVNLEPPSGLHTGPEFNRYVFSALLSLEEGQPEDQQMDLHELATLTLDAYLSQRPRGESDPDTEVLIFDQFEEILTQDPMDRAGKMAFFSQVGAALRNRKRWALFAMREDYVAALDPYLRPIPTRLANNFRLDLLGVEASLQAVQNPVLEAGVEMTVSTARRLIDDLRRVQIQRPDGMMEEQLGPYVEPVQLQVVCFRLWQQLAPDDTQITEEDLETVGDVDESLAEYYAERVAATALETGIREREIRDWFDHHLITESGIRGQVMLGPQKSEGLDNQAIRLLENAHLVRAEKRRGATWFELAHDRLLSPVRLNNTAWSQTHLSMLQRQATLWDNQERFDGLVLRDRDLEEAEQWASEHAGELTETDQEFLKRCQEIRAREEESRAAAERQLKLEAAEKLAAAERQRAEEQSQHAAQLRRRAFVLVIALGFALAMAALAGFFWNQTNNYAESQETLAAENAYIAALKAQIAAENANIAATSQANEKMAISESIAAATARAEAEFQRATAVAEGQQADLARADAEIQRDKAESLRKQGLSSSLALLSTEYLDRQSDLALLLGIESYRWNTASWQAINALFSGLGRNIGRKSERYGDIPQQLTGIFHLAFSPDGQYLAWGGSQGVVVLWQIQEQQPAKTWYAPSGDTVYALAFNHKGNLLAYGAGGKVIVRNALTGRLEKEINTSYNYIFDLAFSPNGKYLAINGQSRRIDLWDLEKWSYVGSLVGDSGVAPCSLVWSPLGNYLAVACSGLAEKIYIWNPVNKQQERTLDGLEGIVLDMAWSPDGRLLVSAGEDDVGEKDKILLVWDLATRKATSLPGHKDKVRAVAFSSDGRVLASGSADRSVILWDTNNFVPVDQLQDFGDQVTSLDFSAQGESLLAASSLDRTVKLYKLIPRESLYEIVSFGKGLVKSLSFLTDSTLAVAGGKTDRIELTEVNRLEDGEKPGAVIPGRFFSAAIHPNGEQLALGGENGIIRIQEIQSGDVLKEFQVSDRRILSLAFHPSDESLAISLCKDSDKNADPCMQNEIQFWDIRAETAVQTGCILTDHTDSIRSLAFRPDGQMLASGGNDRNIYLYSGPFTGCPAQVEKVFLASHSGGVASLAFRLPVGDLLAVGGNDGKLALWVVESRQKVGNPILGNGGDLLSLAFSPDGMRLASGDEDGFVLLWDMDIASWVTRACELARRNLTRQEWNEFISGENYRKTCDQWSADGQP